jgi:hypothetical protein
MVGVTGSNPVPPTTSWKQRSGENEKNRPLAGFFVSGSHEVLLRSPAVLERIELLNTFHRDISASIHRLSSVHLCR